MALIDTSKEYILCAAFKIRFDPPRLAKMKEEGMDPTHIYCEPHRQVFGTVTGWRHADILYRFSDIIDQTDTGGFLTSLGRYVDRHEAAEIAYKCGQLVAPKRTLYSEDLY